jgi:serine/threonine-protein kinase HipA
MDLAFTDEAIVASEIFEKSGGIINLPDFFISGGSSAGGARPKVLAQSADKLLIVKFPSITDPGSEVMAHLEFFGLNCIRLAGIPVPDFFLIKASSSRLALAIKRFDINGENGRHHFLSMQSLVGIEEQLGLPYARMADILRKISVEPQKDIQALYKQMAINIIIANCDDHLKNFAMRYDYKAKGYRLSPAYDVVPNLWQQEHILSVAGQTKNISAGNLLTTGKEFGLSQTKSKYLLAQVVEAVSMALVESKDVWQKMTSNYPLCQQLYQNIQTSCQQLAHRVIK